MTPSPLALPPVLRLSPKVCLVSFLRPLHFAGDLTKNYTKHDGLSVIKNIPCLQGNLIFRVGVAPLFNYTIASLPNSVENVDRILIMRFFVSPLSHLHDEARYGTSFPITFSICCNCRIYSLSDVLFAKENKFLMLIILFENVLRPQDIISTSYKTVASLTLLSMTSLEQTIKQLKRHSLEYE